MAVQTEKNDFEYVGKWVARFGKYKGMMFSDMVEKDRDYAKWMATTNNSDQVRIYLKTELLARYGIRVGQYVSSVVV